MQRGEVWWATLPEPVGSEPRYRRRVLIIQSDNFNRSRIATVIAMVITSNTKLAQALGNVFLPQRLVGLPKDSVANMSQVVTVDKNFLSEKATILPQRLLEQVEAGLRLVLKL